MFIFCNMKIRENLSIFLRNEISLEALLQGDTRSLIACSFQTLFDSKNNTEDSSDSDGDESISNNEEREFLCAFAYQILRKMNEYDPEKKKDKRDLYEFERSLYARIFKIDVQSVLSQTCNCPIRYQKKLDSLIAKHQEELKKKQRHNVKFLELASKTPKLDLLKQKKDDGKKSWSKRFRYGLYKLLRINPKDRYTKKIRGRFAFLVVTSLVMASFTTILAFSALNGAFGFTIASFAAPVATTVAIGAVVFVVSWIVLYTIFSFLSSFFSSSFNKGMEQIFQEPNSLKFLRGWHWIHKARIEKHFLPWIDAVGKGNFNTDNGKFVITDEKGEVSTTRCDSLFLKKLVVALNYMHDKKKYYGASYFTPFLDLAPFLFDQLKEMEHCTAKLENFHLLTQVEIDECKVRLQNSANLFASALENAPKNAKDIWCDKADFSTSKSVTENKLGLHYDEKDKGYWFNNLSYVLTYISFMTSSDKIADKIKSDNRYKDFVDDRMENYRIMGFAKFDTKDLT